MVLLSKIVWRCNLFKCTARFATNSAVQPKVDCDDTMAVWQVSSYGKIDRLQFLTGVKAPVIRKPNEVLVKVLAASVNPIDMLMLGGYGHVLLDTIRMVYSNCKQNTGLPLILGRDFTGQIIRKGSNVRNDLKIGDVVYGVIPPHAQGCHAELAVTEDRMVCHKPEFVSNEEAAGILYTAMTAWSALKVTGDLLLTGTKNKRVLVIGGSGGVGSIAIQMLKAWDVEVVTTCRTDAIPLVEQNKPNLIIDYTLPSSMGDLLASGKYDIILDASGNATPSVYVPMLKDWKNSKFVTLRSPLLLNTDDKGLFLGMIQNTAELVKSNLCSGAAAKGSTIRWAYFLPLPIGIEEVSALVNAKLIRPVVEKVYPFKELPKAYERIKEGHLRGKVIVSMKEEVNSCSAA